MDDTDDKFFRRQLFRALPDQIASYAKEESSGLRMLREVFEPVIKGSDNYINMLSKQFRNAKPQVDPAGLFLRLKKFEMDAAELKAVGEEQSQRVRKHAN